MNAVYPILLLIGLTVGLQLGETIRLPKPPVFTITGATSGYNFGYSIGRTLYDRIEGFYALNTWADDMRKLYRLNGTVHDLVVEARQRHERMFPSLMTELDGIADAVGKIRDDVFIDNIAPEIDQWFYANGGWPYVPDSPPTTRVLRRINKCTDLIIANSQTLAHGHNEDWDSETAEFMAVVSTQDWTSYNYPGDFVGTSFLYNKWGLTLSMNSIYPNQPGFDWEHSYGLAFVLRLVANSRSIQEVIDTVTAVPIYSGYSINVLSACEQVGINIEAYGNEVRIKYLHPNKTPGNQVHMNEYIDLAAISQWTKGDSGNRLKCYQNWPKSFTTVDDIRTFLGDRKCPIWRSSAYADTMCEWIADAHTKTIKAYVNPTVQSNEPDYVFPWNFVCVV